MDGLRIEVSNLQRKLSEVELQGLRGRLLARRLDSEREAYESRHCDYVTNAARLRDAGSPGFETAPTRSAPSSPSRSVIRLIAAPKEVGTDEDDEELQKVRLLIEEALIAQEEELETFEKTRAESIQKRDAATALLREALLSEVAGLEDEMLRFCFALEALLALRRRDAERRRDEEEIEELTRRRAALIERAEVVLLTRNPDKSLEALARANAGGHEEFRRRAEILEQREGRMLAKHLEAAQQSFDGKVQSLETELQKLRRCCNSHRQRRRLVLDGLKADVCLLRKKLTVLEVVAEEASAGIVRAANQERRSQS